MCQSEYGVHGSRGSDILCAIHYPCMGDIRNTQTVLLTTDMRTITRSNKHHDTAARLIVQLSETGWLQSPGSAFPPTASQLRCISTYCIQQLMEYQHQPTQVAEKKPTPKEPHYFKSTNVHNPGTRCWHGSRPAQPESIPQLRTKPVEPGPSIRGIHANHCSILLHNKNTRWVLLSTGAPEENVPRSQLQGTGCAMRMTKPFSACCSLLGYGYYPQPY